MTQPAQITQKGFMAATIDTRISPNVIVSKISMKRGSLSSNMNTIAPPPSKNPVIKEIKQEFSLYRITENSDLFSTTEQANKSGNITALFMEDDSESSLRERDCPQAIPQFVQPADTKRLQTTSNILSKQKSGTIKETGTPLYEPTEIQQTENYKDLSSSHIMSQSFFHEKCLLRSHMDVVRDAQFSCGLNYLVTVSEDCMVKLWDIKALKKNPLPHPVRMEPCFTFRGHTGPLFTACVGSGLQQSDHFLYTAGNEGIIRIWSIPNVESTKFPITNGKNFCVGLWTSHRDVVWQLVHHPTEDLLLSVSADGTVKMWKEFDISELVDSVDISIFTEFHRTKIDSNDCLLGAFVYKSTSKQSYEIPTSAAWIKDSSNSLLISYANSFLGLFDRTTVFFQYGLRVEKG